MEQLLCAMFGTHGMKTKWNIAVFAIWDNFSKSVYDHLNKTVNTEAVTHRCSVAVLKN